MMINFAIADIAILILGVEMDDTTLTGLATVLSCLFLFFTIRETEG